MKSLSVVAAGLLAPVFAFAEIRELDDEQIANVVITAHRVAIETGQLADSKSANPAVREYADRRTCGPHRMRTTTAGEAPAGPGGCDGIVAQYALGHPWHDHRRRSSSSPQLQRNPLMLPNHALWGRADFPSILKPQILDTHGAKTMRHSGVSCRP